jgi:hypothetical protein
MKVSTTARKKEAPNKAFIGFIHHSFNLKTEF